MPVLNAAWAATVARLRAFMTQAGPGHSLLPVPISTLGGWHPEAHRANSFDCTLYRISRDGGVR